MKTLLRPTFWWLVIYCLSTLVVGCSTSPTKIDGHSSDSSLTQQKSIFKKLGIVVDSIDEALAKGEMAIRDAQREKALFYFQQALKFDKNNFTALNKTAKIYSESAMWDQASRVYEKLVTLDPTNAETHKQYGLVLLNNRIEQEAIKELSLAVDLNPKCWRCLNGLGYLADLSGEYKKAVSFYEKALILFPNNPIILNNYGYSHYLVGNWQDARKYFKQSLRTNPNNPLAIRNLALIETREQAYQSAILLFGRVMSESEAYNNMGYFCLLDNRFQKAEEFLKVAIKLSPSYYENAHNNLRRLDSLRTLVRPRKID